MLLFSVRFAQSNEFSKYCWFPHPLPSVLLLCTVHCVLYDWVYLSGSLVGALAHQLLTAKSDTISVQLPHTNTHSRAHTGTDRPSKHEHLCQLLLVVGWVLSVCGVHKITTNRCCLLFVFAAVCSRSVADTRTPPRRADCRRHTAASASHEASPVHTHAHKRTNTNTIDDYLMTKEYTLIWLKFKLKINCSQFVCRRNSVNKNSQQTVSGIFIRETFSILKRVWIV